MALIVVALLYGVLQVALVTQGRAAEWDEAVYISQVDASEPAADFAAHRARGITWAIWPVVVAGADLTAVRAFLLVLSTAGLALAFSAWLPAIGWGAPAGAALFGVTWLSIYYGSAVSPNLLGALLAVGAVGTVVRLSVRWAARSLLAASGLVAALVVVRPLDGGVVLLICVGYGWWALRERFAATSLSLGVGAVLGAIPWLVEAFARFDGPLKRLDFAQGPIDSGPTFTVVEHLRLLDGRPLVGPDPIGTISRGGLLAWGLGLGLVVVALLLMRADSERRGVVAASAGGAVLAVPYFLWVGATAPRFLLPAYGLFAVSGGAGVALLVRRRRWVVVAFVAVGLAIVTNWHLGKVGTVDERETAAAADRAAVAAVLDTAADGRPCEFASEFGHPQLQLVSGCLGSAFDRADPDSAYARLRDAADRGVTGFIVLGAPPDDLVLPGDWSVVPTGVGDWTIYELLGS